MMKRKIIEVISALAVFGIETILLMIFAQSFFGSSNIFRVISDSIETIFENIYLFSYIAMFTTYLFLFLFCACLELFLVKLCVKKFKQLNVITMIVFCLDTFFYYFINVLSSQKMFLSVALYASLIVTVFKCIMLGLIINSNKEVFFNDKNKKHSKNI